MKVLLIVLAILLVFGLMIGGKAASVNNQLVTQREAITGAWSQVDVALQRRADLIPNLVESVKGIAAHEKSVVDSVASARAALVNGRTPADKIRANADLENALGRLLVVVENYPQIKASESFLRLQDELAGTENRVAQERRKYNEVVQKYNVTLGLFPNNIFAGMLGFVRNDDYFKTEPSAREAPKVKF